jgi:glutamate-5-semialdehyde dehydrogenase
VCNAAESLLVDEAAAAALLPPVLSMLASHGVALVGDEKAREVAAATGVAMDAATEQDWGTEYLDLKMSVKCVRDYHEAIAHINRYGTGHSEAIVTQNYAASEAFLQGVDAACVYVNASTRFTDGGMFGLGAEIGISTQKLHVRGPMGADVLTSTKYLLRGEGQVR